MLQNGLDVVRRALRVHQHPAVVLPLDAVERGENLVVLRGGHVRHELPAPRRHQEVEVPDLGGEAIVRKTYGDSFEGTDLEDVLAERGVGRLVVTGAQTDACIRSTLHGALVRGYDATLVGDAHTTEDLSEYGAPTPDLVVAHTNLYWDWAKAPGRVGGVASTADVTFASSE